MVKILKQTCPLAEVTVELFDGYEILSVRAVFGGWDCPLPEWLWADALLFVSGNPLPDMLRQYFGG